MFDMGKAVTVITVLVFGVIVTLVLGQKDQSSDSNDVPGGHPGTGVEGSQVRPSREENERDEDREIKMVVETVRDVNQKKFIQQLGNSARSVKTPLKRNRREVTKRNIRRKKRSQIDESTQIPRLNAIQLRLDKEKYSNFTVSDELPKLRWWRPVDWCENHTSRFFEYDNCSDSIRLLRSGLYYIYAQITYKNVASLNKYEVKVDEEKSLFSCTQERRFPTATSPSSIPVFENCHAGSVALLQAKQKVSMWNSNKYFRPMDLSPQATFWGIMRIGNR